MVEPEPVFVQHCRVCGLKIETRWGPEVHAESRFAVEQHFNRHTDAELLVYARQEALSGT